jgi:uncharacterized protein DUF4326
MRPTQVCNVRTETFTIYCGRAVPRLGLSHSKWANPFHIGRDGDRATVIEKYRAWLFANPALLAALGELAGHKLGCWCAPDKCHCDLLAALADQVHSSGIPATAAAAARIAQRQCPHCAAPLQPLADQPDDLRCEPCQATYRPRLAVLVPAPASRLG